MNFRLLKILVVFLFLVAILSGCSLFGNDPNDPPGSVDPITGKHTYANRLHGNSHVRSSLMGAGVGEDINVAANMRDQGNDFWNHLRSDLQLAPADDNPEVKAQINWFMHNQDYLSHTINRAAPYMYYILQQTEQRNLPSELVLLPIMESAYNPFARNPSGALGMWQLMRGTASGYGVKQDFWYDGRRDIYSSTNAALDYLTYLQSYFGGDWLLALGAYDAGEGTIQNAIHRNAVHGEGSDFWSLPLPMETKSYVPRLLALAAIVRNPARYGITLPPINDRPYLAQVDVGVAMNLAQAARFAGMSLIELKSLNPGYNRTTTGPNGPYRLILPLDRISIFKEQLEANGGITQTKWGRYRIQHGDSLASIAKHFHTTTSELRLANHIKHFRVGSIIMIPTSTQLVRPHLTMMNALGQTITPPTTAVASTNAALPQDNSNAVEDQTQAVDQNSSDDDTTTSANDNDDNTDTTDATETPKSLGSPIHVTVKKGDTLNKIADKYHVTARDIMSWNKLKSSRNLQPGMKLVINGSKESSHQTVAKKAVKQTAKATKSSTKLAAKPTKATKHSLHVGHYAVQPGDTLSEIADQLHVKTSDLKKWNNLSSDGTIQPGQHLVVYH